MVAALAGGGGGGGAAPTPELCIRYTLYPFNPRLFLAVFLAPQETACLPRCCLNAGPEAYHRVVVFRASGP